MMIIVNPLFNITEDCNNLDMSMQPHIVTNPLYYRVWSLQASSARFKKNFNINATIN